MVLLIIILCAIFFIVGLMTDNNKESSEAILSLMVGACMSLIPITIFISTKGANYFKPVYRKGDKVVYQDTSYGKIDGILYIINGDTIGYGDIKNK